MQPGAPHDEDDEAETAVKDCCMSGEFGWIVAQNYMNWIVEEVADVCEFGGDDLPNSYKTTIAYGKLIRVLAGTATLICRMEAGDKGFGAERWLEELRVVETAFAEFKQEIERIIKEKDHLVDPRDDL